MEEYRGARIKAVNICRALERQYEDDFMKKVKSLSGSGDIRKMYQHIKRKVTQGTILCNDAKGNLLVNEDDVLKRRSVNFVTLHGGNASRLP